MLDSDSIIVTMLVVIPICIAIVIGFNMLSVTKVVNIEVIDSISIEHNVNIKDISFVNFTTNPDKIVWNWTSLEPNVTYIQDLTVKNTGKYNITLSYELLDRGLTPESIYDFSWDYNNTIIHSNESLDIALSLIPLSEEYTDFGFDMIIKGEVV